MKLPSTVLNAMRGIGGATLIAAAVAGCGGAQEARSVEPQLIAAQSDRNTSDRNTNRNQVPDAEETPITPDYDYDVAVACGRG